MRTPDDKVKPIVFTLGELNVMDSLLCAWKTSHTLPRRDWLLKEAEGLEWKIVEALKQTH